jgi:uncharacterized FlgJ-related protein
MMASFLRRLFRRRKAVASTPLSEFVRNASSAEKKKVYVTALKNASDEQNKVIERASSRRACGAGA